MSCSIPGILGTDFIFSRSDTFRNRKRSIIWWQGLKPLTFGGHFCRGWTRVTRGVRLADRTRHRKSDRAASCQALEIRRLQNRKCTTCLGRGLLPSQISSNSMFREWSERHLTWRRVVQIDLTSPFWQYIFTRHLFMMSASSVSISIRVGFLVITLICLMGLLARHDHQ